MNTHSYVASSKIGLFSRLDYSQNWFIVNYINWHCKQLAQATLTLNIRCRKCSVSYHDDIQMELRASEINSKQSTID